MQKEKHVLGISGGKDSAALAIYMRDSYPNIDIDYFFTDTGKELPEVYSFLSKLEEYLGKSITRLNAEQGFDYWLAKNSGFLPSPQARWCTNLLKIQPMKKWLKTYTEQGMKVFSYIAIRFDEAHRQGFSGNKDILPKFPFIEDGIEKEDVFNMLENSVGIPEYYKWRSRSGCTFCFFQRKIEWVGLLEKHPEAFKEAMYYEKDKFTWSQGESLEQLSRPGRVKEIKESYQRRIELEKIKKSQGYLFETKENSGFCDICHK